MNENEAWNYCPICMEIISGNRKGESFLLEPKASMKVMKEEKGEQKESTVLKRYVAAYSRSLLDYIESIHVARVTIYTGKTISVDH